MCYRVKFGSSTTKGVRIHIREPKNWGALGTRPHWDRADPLKTSPSYIKFGSSASKDVRRNRKEPPKIGQHWGTAPLHWGVPDTMRSSTHVFRAARSNSDPRVPPFKIT